MKENVNGKSTAQNSGQNEINNDIILKLREEQFDILKKRVQTGEVSIRKEIIEEEKNMVVAVTREELVIEKKVLNKGEADETGRNAETIRIPISEEKIEVIKHPVILANVDVITRQFEEMEHVKVNLKREKLHVKAIGGAVVIDENTVRH